VKYILEHVVETLAVIAFTFAVLGIFLHYVA
jgi:hypothetical protein